MASVVIWDAWTWFAKRNREERGNCFGKWTVLLCWTDLELCTRDGWPIADLWWRLLHPQSLFYSCDHRKKEKKKKEGERRAWKLFWKLDCLAMMNRSWTMQKRWVTDSWPVMASASPLKSLPQLWSSMRRLGPPKNKEKSVKTVLETGLSCCDEQILNCAKEMGDW